MFLLIWLYDFLDLFVKLCDFTITTSIIIVNTIIFIIHYHFRRRMLFPLIHIIIPIVTTLWEDNLYRWWWLLLLLYLLLITITTLHVVICWRGLAWRFLNSYEQRLVSLLDVLLNLLGLLDRLADCILQCLIQHC